MKLSLQVTIKLAQLLESFNILFLPRAATDENKHESCWQLPIKENPAEKTLAKIKWNLFF